MIRTNSFVMLLLLLAGNIFATDVRQWIREGNNLFEEGRYAEAEEKYLQSLEHDADNFKALFNLGNALYMQGRLGEAQEVFDALSFVAPSDEGKASALHNLGNAYLGAGQIPESIEAYKRALRLMPDEEDTRYNLAYALNLLDEMPPAEEPQHDDTTPPTSEEDISPDRIDQLSPQDAERILEAMKQQEQKIQERINREDQTREPVRTIREW